MVQFDRFVKVEIVTKSSLVSIEGLRVVFEVEKSGIAIPNKAMVEIWNLSLETQRKIREEGEDFILYAGYNGTGLDIGNVQPIFKGNINNLLHERRGKDHVTILYGVDGGKDLQNSTFNRAYSRNVTAETIIKDMMETFKGITVGVAAGTECLKRKFASGISFSGKTSNLIEEITKDCGVTFQVTDGQAELLGSIDSVANRSAIVIKATTGMLTPPEITEIGVNVKTLLNPELKPIRLIDIQSPKSAVSKRGDIYYNQNGKNGVTGFFIINDVKHIGDTHGNNWTTEVKTRRQNG